MNLNRRDFSAALVGTALGGLSVAARAQAPVEGQQYLRLQPSVPTSTGNKIEVIEFFSYACPHCFEFEPTLEAWIKTLPPDVMFHRVPVPFLFNYENFQRLYYTLETLGKVDAMQLKVFNAVHVEHQRLDKPADMAALVNKVTGVDQAKFLDIYNSFSVATSVGKAKKLVLDSYKVDSVPMLAIQGRWTTSPGQARGAEAAVNTANFLIAQARKG
ncbi:MAG: thiol:disulfide interchange protein DsbA/DsbL [Proteobacteria bacterium]|nr:thiol:disulfide interchange protein DsbA/DsbL [Pseudomonadota bacterium]